MLRALMMSSGYSDYMRHTLKLLCLYHSVITRGKLVAQLSLYETPHL
jgi:hypothetical protein